MMAQARKPKTKRMNWAVTSGSTSPRTFYNLSLRHHMVSSKLNRSKTSARQVLPFRRCPGLQTMMTRLCHTAQDSWIRPLGVILPASSLALSSSRTANQVQRAQEINIQFQIMLKPWLLPNLQKDPKMCRQKQPTTRALAMKSPKMPWNLSGSQSVTPSWVSKEERSCVVVSLALLKLCPVRCMWRRASV